MKINTGIRFILLLIISAFSGLTPAKEPVNNLTISFQNFVGNEKVELDSGAYLNSLNQSFTISKLRYYIGNISLTGPDNKIFSSDDYFLIDEEDSASKFISLEIPEGNYSVIDFTIGVDSADNCSGAQSGALDPVNGMFWAWNTGYVFLKLEGHSPASSSTGNLIEFHIGGYKAPYNCIRQISLPFNVFNVSTGKKSELIIQTDVSELFKNPVKINFEEISSVTDFHNSVLIADNYMDMFSIKTREQ